MQKKRSWHKITIAILLLNIPLLFSSFLVESQAKDTITVLIEEWPPFRIADAKSPSGFKGIDIDLLTSIEKKMGLHFKIIRQPWARCLESIRTGQGDLISGVAFSKERAEYIHYIQPSYFSIGPVFYVRKGAGKTIQRYEDLKKLLIGCSIKSVYFEPFDSDTNLRKHSVSKEDQLLKMLSSGRLDAIIGTDINISLDAQRLGLTDQVEPANFIPQQRIPLYIGVSKQSHFLNRSPELSIILQDLLNSGVVDNLKNRYIP